MSISAQAARARKQYQSHDVAGRVEGADPHALVAILYDELISTLDIALAAQKRAHIEGFNHQRTRAQTILIALSASLDLERGGDVAQRLAGIYAAMQKALGDAEVEKIAELRDGVVTLAAAWKALATPRA
jgi:flagellar secretion chaperone FliS